MNLFDMLNTEDSWKIQHQTANHFKLKPGQFIHLEWVDDVWFTGLVVKNAEDKHGRFDQILIVESNTYKSNHIFRMRVESLVHCTIEVLYEP